MSKARSSDHFRGLGETVAALSPDEQLDFLHGFTSGHDRLANEIHQQTRGREDGRPVWHDKMARMLTEMRRHLEAYPKKADK